MAVRVSSTVNRVLLKDPNGPVSITTAKHYALVRDADGPVIITNTVHRVLIQTEAPPADTNVYTPYVVEQVLIQENGSPSKVTSVSWSTLIQELPGSAYALNMRQLTLAQTEAPIVEERLTKVTHSALTADLERGVQLLSLTISQTIIRTEPLSRNPERYKVIVPSTAHPRAVVNPADIQSNSRLTLMSKQVVLESPRMDPIYGRSHRLRQTTWSSVVLQANATKPEEVRDRKRIQIIGLETAHSTTPRSPLDFRQWAPMPSIASLTATSTTYANGLDIHSEKHVNCVNISTAAYSSGYTSLPRSQINISAFKYEVAHQFTEYLDPSDIRLKPVVAVQQVEHTTAHSAVFMDPQLFRSEEHVLGFKVETAHETTAEDPSLIRSTPVMGSMLSATASETEYDPPQGIYPSARTSQARGLVAMASPDYGQFPRSFQSLRDIKQETLHRSLYKNPADIKKTEHAHQLNILTVSAALYGEPERIKPKRRTSSARVTKR